ncbi:MAG: ISKra4 family transposase, partial [Actinomycetota bacterium]|nr:ISKra4 family transposase [Actinomycetota bacterium]
MPLPERGAPGGDGAASSGEARCGIEGFSRSAERFWALAGWLAGEQARGLEHAQLEARLEQDSRELIRALLQDHLDLRSGSERRLELVVGAEGARRANVERSHARALETIFGEVEVKRLAYRARGAENLYPADAQLNLPAERHSHGVRRLAALESPRSSFQDAQAAILRQTGQRFGTRQLRELTAAAAVDFKAFYEQRQQVVSDRDDMLVLSCDGKGVVMRPEAVRAPAQKHAQSTPPKLAARLSKGEKRGRKRMAEVCAVYDLTPAERSAADILPADEHERQAARPAPEAKNKWLSASVREDASTIVS